MYGWFESGGGVEMFFRYTKMIDVLLRSETESNNIVIGNSNNTTAALYISKNNIGVKRLPDENNSITVVGNSEFETLSVANNIKIDSNSIQLDGDYFIGFNGFSKNKVVLTDVIKQFRLKVENAQIISLTSPTQYIFRVVFQITPAYYNVFVIGEFIKIKNVLFRILNVLEPTIIEITNALENSTSVPFSTNDTVDIDIFSEPPVDFERKEMALWCTVLAYNSFWDTMTVSLSINDLSINISEILQVNHIYRFKWAGSVKHLLKLTSWQLESNDTITVVLKTLNSQNISAGIVTLAYPIELVKQDIHIPV